MTASRTLTTGETIIVDECDAWLLDRSPVVRQFRTSRTIQIEVGGRSRRLSRFIMQPPKGMVVDHINGDVMDNRRANLRICTVQQNNWNRRCQVANGSGFKGVQRANKNRWRAVIFPHGRRRHLGCFAKAEEAARAYDAAALEEYGEFACLNFPTAEDQRSAIFRSFHDSGVNRA